ncbi:MAG: helix-turn-helix domain-containing protein [Gammaproteobacteria bacterium]|nr:helix-turn-helix domain-containing protein [Gammaproteobacteria bacterium]
MESARQPVAPGLLMDRRQAANYLNISPAYLSELRSQGKVKARLIGTKRMVRYHVDDLERFAASLPIAD